MFQLERASKFVSHVLNRGILPIHRKIYHQGNRYLEHLWSDINVCLHNQPHFQKAFGYEHVFQLQVQKRRVGARTHKTRT